MIILCLFSFFSISFLIQNYSSLLEKARVGMALKTIVKIIFLRIIY